MKIISKHFSAFFLGFDS